MECPKCGPVETNKENAFCSRCGTPLNEPSSNFNLSTLSSPSKSSQAKKIFLGVGIGLFIACLAGAGFILSFHSNNLSQIVPTSQMTSEASTLLSSSQEETAFSAPTASQFTVYSMEYRRRKIIGS